MFRKHMNSKYKRKNKSRRLFDPDNGSRPLEVIQETIEDNDEIINEGGKAPHIPSKEKDDLGQSELKSIMVCDKTREQLKSYKVQPNNINDKNNTSYNDSKILVSFPITKSSLGENDKSNPSVNAKRPCISSQNSEESKKILGKPFNYINDIKAR